MKIQRLSRKVHRWGSILIALPLIIVVITGVVLQVKKEFDWIQPPTQRGGGTTPSIGFDRILEVAQSAEKAAISSWEDIDRLDVRPDKGVVKVRGKNRWEIQIDSNTGDLLQVAYRRSDWIESIHDGSFFQSRVKLWVFLPAAVVLTVLWGTGIYLFFLPYSAKRRRNRRQRDIDRTGRVDLPDSAPERSPVVDRNVSI
jgi:uncharacterized iron-regulated membrane protein